MMRSAPHLALATCRVLVTAGVALLVCSCGGGDDASAHDGSDVGAGGGDAFVSSDAPGAPGDAGTPRADAGSSDVGPSDAVVGRTCSEGSLRCADAEIIETCLNGQWIAAAMCTSSQTCDDGQCVATDRPCVASCAGRICGDDGCGGSCGACPAAEPNCRPDGTCTSQCVPACQDKQCGADGCGSSCGSCTAQAPDCIGGQCTGPCQSDCLGRNCGDDGCGGSCGTCAPLAPHCVVGVCTAECTASCVSKSCGDDGCGGSCGSCSSGTACNAAGICQQLCQPSCSGKSCGADGCGGSCGSCAGGWTCTGSGQCVAQCTPQCAGKQCGPDGCGGSCGSCPGGSACSGSGTCGGGGGGGACDNTSDQAILQTIDPQAAAADCGGGCVTTGDPAGCTTSCLVNETGLSQGCASCFGALLQCAIDNCIGQCLDPGSAACATCTEQQCLGAFSTCSGYQG